MSFEKFVQNRLRVKGYNVVVDGVWGRQSINALKKFQEENGLPVTGTTTNETLEALKTKEERINPASKAQIPTEDMPPWMRELHTRMGQHELHNNKALIKFMKIGRYLGNPKNLPWCFTGDVEILTEDGWQRFDELSSNRVYQVNDNLEASLTTYKPIVKEFDGRVYETLGITFDENHRWYGQFNKDKPDRFGLISEIQTNGLRLSKLKNKEVLQKNDLTHNDLHLLAAFISDGSYRENKKKISFQVSKERKVTNLTSLNPFYKKKSKSVYGNITKTPLTEFYFKTPKFFEEVFDDYKVLNNKFINSLSFDQLRAFLDYYVIYDGHVNKNGRYSLYTSCLKNVEVLSTICFLAGYNSYIEVKHPSRTTLSDKLSYIVGFTPHSTKKRKITKSSISNKNFTGNLYCVSVPEERIIVRGSDKIAVVTGNCGDAIESAIVKTLPEEVTPNNPFWAQAWKNFGVGTIGPIVGSIGVIRWNSKSGHVGVVAGYDKKRNRVYLLGGNQSNEINITSFPMSKFIAFRWPSTYPLKHYPALKADSVKVGDMIGTR